MNKIVVGNFKMNLSLKKEVDDYISKFKKELNQNKSIVDKISIIVCPSFVWLDYFSKKLKRKNVFLGAQNVHSEENGSFTGETSISMLKEIGTQFVIIGHNERRNYFAEKNDFINKKIAITLKNKLQPILCIGETEEERETGKIKKVITAQIIEALKNISKTQTTKIIFAYEPVWSVGSNNLPTMEEIMTIRILIQKILREKIGIKKNNDIKILYGGSVNWQNVKELCLETGMDGVLVGRQSLKPKNFVKIIKQLN